MNLKGKLLAVFIILILFALVSSIGDEDEPYHDSFLAEQEQKAQDYETYKAEHGLNGYNGYHHTRKNSAAEAMEIDAYRDAHDGNYPPGYEGYYDSSGSSDE